MEDALLSQKVYYQDKEDASAMKNNKRDPMEQMNKKSDEKSYMVNERSRAEEVLTITQVNNQETYILK